MSAGESLGVEMRVFPAGGVESGQGARLAGGFGDGDERAVEIGAKTMRPSSPQLPPQVIGGTFERKTAVPPESGTFLSSSTVKKPIHCPSGEKKEQSLGPGDRLRLETLEHAPQEPSLTAMGARIHDRPSVRRDGHARMPARGEAIARGQREDGPHDNRRESRGAAGRSRGTAAAAIAAPRSAPPTAAASRPPRLGAGATAAGSDPGGSSSSMRASAMSWSRRFGSLFRQRRRSWRTRAGVSARKADQSGSARSVADRMSDGVSAAKAAPGQAFEHHTSEGQDVGAFVERLAQRLLGAHVGRGAENAPAFAAAVVSRGREGGNDLSAGGRPRAQAKVEGFRRWRRPDHDVRRLQVAMDDSRLVRRLEARGDARATTGPVDRQRSRREPLGERRSSTSAMKRIFEAQCSSSPKIAPTLG